MDRARRDRVDADVVGPEFARERIGETDHAGLGGRVGDEVRAAEHPGDRGKIDDGAVAELLHVRMHRLRREELVLQVDVHRAVPRLRSDLAHPLAGIVGGVVDEHGDRPELLPNARDRRFQRINVGEVAMQEHRRAGKVGNERFRRLVIHVDESDVRPLGGKRRDHGRPDAGRAASDEYDPILDTRIGSEGARTRS